MSGGQDTSRGGAREPGGRPAVASSLGTPAWLLEPAAPRAADAAGLGRRHRRGLGDRLLTTLGTWVEHAFMSDDLARRRGLLQRLDPRVKLVTMVAMIVVAALSSDLVVLAGFLALAVGLVLASDIGLGRFAGRAWVFIPLFTAAVMLPALFNVVTPGRALVTFWSGGAPWPLPDTLAVTAPGVIVFVRLLLRVTAVVSLAVLLTLTTPWADLFRAMRVVGVPRTFVFVLSVAYRYVFTLVRLVQDMAVARTSRTVGRVGAGEERHFLGAAVAAVFGKSQATSEQVYLAMLARGYAGEPRTLSSWRTGALDWVWAAGVALVIAAAVWFEVAVGPW
ncbi:MAG TPA: cobalt ECF transporter T component CbiQ [Thermoleophilia bacterium]|nr:cobalt ECF transporter T component CbiQ [Thermoleophilia bacterium]